MTTANDELIEIFRNLSDEELQRRWQSHSLTDVARELMAQELKVRDIPQPPLPAPETDADAITYTASELTTLATFSTPFEAQILRAQLESEGLFVIVSDEHMVGANQFLAPAVGGVRVQVLASCLPQAHEIMKITMDGALALPKEDDEYVAPTLSPKEAALLAYTQDPGWLKVWQPLIEKPGVFASFNFFAFLFGSMWCVFRKMYFWGAIIFFAEFSALEFALGKLGLLWLILGIRLFIGVFGNALYYIQAVNAIEKIQAAAPADMQKQLKLAGGINMGAMIAVLGASALLRFLIVNL